MALLQDLMALLEDLTAAKRPLDFAPNPVPSIASNWPELRPRGWWCGFDVEVSWVPFSCSAA
jgi:hypothetical protein